MAIDAKVSFMNQLAERMAGVLTVEQMGKLRAETVNLMDHFEMTELQMLDAQDDDLLKCYIDTMRVECRSEKTIARYEYVIKRLMDAVKIPTRQITVHHLRNYLAAEQKRGLMDSSLESTRQVFSAYFNWLQRESLIEKNPVANLGPVKVAKKEKKTYSEIDIEKLVRGTDDVRLKTIIYFLASTGCRISEMTGLNREQVNLTTLECVVRGKGNKERTVYLSAIAGMMLNEYLQTRTDDNPALFVGRRIGRTERLEPGGVRMLLKELQKKTGVEHVHPHKFRRTLATKMAMHGMPIQTICQILGYEKIDTTLKYVVLNKEDIKSSYRRYA